jgi:ABC-type multidrug transport system ATPase subunit
MHEGRMIFAGSMQDMKRRLSRDDFTLELEGNDEDIQHLAQEATKLDGLDARIEAGDTLVVGIGDGRNRSGALAEVLRLVDAGNVSLQGIHSGQNVTENAYLQLLQEDEAHGFGR